MNEAATLNAVTELRPVTFEAFYRSAWDRVYRTLAIILRDPDLAAEATDEAMTRAFQRWSSVGEYDNPTGWVFRVALNFSRTRLARRRRETPLAVEFGSWEMSVPVPELVPALVRLPLEFREVVVLRYLWDWSERDIAAALDLPGGTVKSRLHRALARLRKDLS